MIIFKRVYAISFYMRSDPDQTNVCTMRGRRDAHDMLQVFNKLYGDEFVATDVRRVK